MTYSTLIDQGDGFLYNSLVSVVGSAISNFTAPAANQWFAVPFNSPVTNSTALQNQYQYVNANGQWQPPIAGWWKLSGTARCYAGPGLYNHYLGLFKGTIAPENQVLQAGGRQCVQAPYQKLVYMNGTTDFIQMAFYSTDTAPVPRSWSPTQTFMNAVFVRP